MTERSKKRREEIEEQQAAEADKKDVRRGERQAFGCLLMFVGGIAMFYFESLWPGLAVLLGAVIFALGCFNLFKGKIL